jgi:hypothetical protein
MCNQIKPIKFKQDDSTLQLYNNNDSLYPEFTEVDQFFATLLIFVSLLITPVYAQASSAMTTVSPIESTTALSTTVFVQSMPPPTPYPLTNDSLTITELVLANSVIVSDDIPIKIPQDYRYIRTKINFGTWYYQLHQGISIVTDTMSQYGTKHEPCINLGIRRCALNQKTGSYCP